jgi:hypothetical protein
MHAALFLLAELKYNRPISNTTLHPDLIVKALAGIEPDTTLEKFQELSGITSRAVTKSVVNFLVGNGVGTIGRNVLKFSGSDRLYASMLAMQIGCDIERVSACLSWKDFEMLASEVLASFGYRTQTNVRMTRPRMEIDVVGVSAGFAIAVDCKHWRRGSASMISGFAEKQVARARRLIKPGVITQAVPVVMTLHSESVMFSGGVPVVPVHKFRSFVTDVKAFLPEIYVAG